MAIPLEKLAQSLEILRVLQTVEGAGAIRARDLSRTHRERLLRNGFLQEVIKGWYIPSRPDEVKGESTAWYASFWRFCAVYLEARFGARWCLSPEQSLSLHAGNWTVPGQLAARSPRAGNKVTKLPHGTSLLELRIALPGVADRKEEAGLRLFSVESALIACSPNYFSNNATDVAQAELSCSRTNIVLLDWTRVVTAARARAGEHPACLRLRASFFPDQQDDSEIGIERKIVVRIWKSIHQLSRRTTAVFEY